MTLHILFCLLIINSFGVSQPPFSIHGSRAGILFERIANAVFAPHQAHVIAVLDLVDLYDESQHLEHLADSMSYAHQSEVNDATFHLMKEVTSVIKQLQIQISRLTNIVPHARTKRAWFNAGGVVLKHIFGTPDHKDAKRWDAEIQQITTITDNIRTAVIHHDIRLEHIEDGLLAHTKQLRVVASELLENQQFLQENVNRDLNIVQHQLQNITTTLSRSRMLQTMFYNLNSVQSQVNTLTAAIQLAVQHQLSPILLPPDVLLRVLTNVSTQLQNPIRPIYPVILQNVPYYYQCISVHLTQENSRILLQLQLPLTCLDCEFESYRIHTFPIAWNHTNKFLQWKTQDYLFVSRDRQSHAVMSNFKFQQCQNSHLIICPEMVLRTSSTSCELSLMLAESKQPPCTRLVVNLSEPLFQHVTTGWLYAVPHPLAISFVCYDHSFTSHTYRVSLKFSGLLFNTSHCDILGPHFKLSATFRQTLNSTVHPFTLFIPDMDLLASEHPILQAIPYRNNGALLTSLDQLMQKEYDQITMDRAIAHLSETHQQTTLFKITIPTATSVLVVLVVICIGIFILKKKNCLPRFKKDNAQNTVPEQTPDGSYNCQSAP